jgi:hypothetical protein
MSFGAMLVALVDLERIVAGVADMAVVPLREAVHAGRKMNKLLHPAGRHGGEARDAIRDVTKRVREAIDCVDQTALT